MLCSLKTVDYITIFEDNTPYNIIKRIRPHILFKGEDYKNTGIIGKYLMGKMEKNRGKIILAPLLDGFSMTLALNNLQG